MLFFNYNVTWNHDKNEIGFAQQVIIPDEISYVVPVAVFGGIVALFVILAAFGVYWSIFRKIGP
jgi:hypothetical protein